MIEMFKKSMQMIMYWKIIATQLTQFYSDYKRKTHFEWKTGIDKTFENNVVFIKKQRLNNLLDEKQYLTVINYRHIFIKTKIESHQGSCSIIQV